MDVQVGMPVHAPVNMMSTGSNTGKTSEGILVDKVSFFAVHDIQAIPIHLRIVNSAPFLDINPIRAIGFPIASVLITNFL